MVKYKQLFPTGGFGTEPERGGWGCFIFLEESDESKMGRVPNAAPWLPYI